MAVSHDFMIFSLATPATFRISGVHRATCSDIAVFTIPTYFLQPYPSVGAFVRAFLGAIMIFYRIWDSHLQVRRIDDDSSFLGYTLPRLAP